MMTPAAVETVKAAMQEANMRFGPGRPMDDNYADALARAALSAPAEKIDLDWRRPLPPPAPMPEAAPAPAPEEKRDE